MKITSMEKLLHDRSESTCELCGSANNLQVYEVPASPSSAEKHILICTTCINQVTNTDKLDPNHWRSLNNSMWSTVPAVQVMVWRVLTRLKNEGQPWAQDLLDMLYLEDDLLNWANAGNEPEAPSAEEKTIHKDSNGTVLQAGDTVVLTKDLEVKGGGFTAKRGTAVRGITLVENNPGQIEGRVNGQQIVILTQYVKKS
jgi:protein PhnA